MEEVVPTHEIEAGVAAPPPRRNRLPGRTQALLLLAGVLALLLLAGGARALLEAARLAWVAAEGRMVTARIAKVQLAPVEAPGQPARPSGLRYEYRDPFTGQTVRRDARFAPESSEETGGLLSGARPREKADVPPLPRVGDALRLRVGRWRGSSLEYFWAPPPLGRGLFLVGCGLAVMGVGSYLLRTLAHWRRLRLRLLQHGQAVIGTIIHKHTEMADMPRYFLRYGYATVPDGDTREHEEQVSREQWSRFEIGQPVTVLYDAEWPARAGLYTLIRG